MQNLLQITFHQLDQSDALKERIRQKAQSLQKFYDRITSMHVWVECPSQKHRHGNLFHIRIDIQVPGGEIVVGRNSRTTGTHQDVYVAVRDAFHAARRQLEDFVRMHFHAQKYSKNRLKIENTDTL